MDTGVYDNQPSHESKDVAEFGSPPATTCVEKYPPQSVDDIPNTTELYATNNPFLQKGPKGFIEVKVLEDNNLYVRVDLPGVPDKASCHKVKVDTEEQKVVFSGETINDGNKKEGVREYSGTLGLGCDCCKMTSVEGEVKHGVLRMIVSRVKVKDQQCTLNLSPFTGKSGRDMEDHPFVVKGRKVASLMIEKEGGGLYLAVDVPGASWDDVDVFFNETDLGFLVEIKNLGKHEECGRVYMGSIQGLPSAPSFESDDISWKAEFGVLEICIDPLPNAPTA